MARALAPAESQFVEDPLKPYPPADDRLGLATWLAPATGIQLNVIATSSAGQHYCGGNFQRRSHGDVLTGKKRQRQSHGSSRVGLT